MRKIPYYSKKKKKRKGCMRRLRNCPCIHCTENCISGKYDVIIFIDYGGGSKTKGKDPFASFDG